MKPLPEEFEALSPFVEQWALGTQNERQSARRSATAEQISAFYKAIFPLMSDILAAVDRFPVGSLPDSYKTLFEMACSLAEIAPHVELYHGSTEVPNSFEESRMVAVHGEYPTWSVRGRTGE